MKHLSRRRLIQSAVAGGIGSSAGCLDSVPSAWNESNPASWPMYQFDAGNTGSAPSHTGPATPVGEGWTFETGRDIVAPPAVRDQTVFVGSTDGTMYAISRADGDETWSYTVDGEQTNAIRSAPAIAEGRVYFGSLDGNVYALSAADGSERWSFEADDMVGASPTLTNDSVYVGDGWLREGRHKLYRLSVRDGTAEWSFETGGIVDSAPAVVDDTVYVSSDDGVVYAVSAADGVEEWSVQTDSTTMTAPVASDGQVYVGAGAQLLAVAVADGSRPWSVDLGTAPTGGPCVHDETVFVSTRDGAVRALSRADGARRWKKQVSQYAAELSPPVVCDGTIYVGGPYNVYALNPADGAELWAVQLDDHVVSPPVAVDGSLYVGSTGGTVYSLAEDTTA